MKLTAREAMELAISEGKKGAGFVSPNPCVGAVILDRNGNLIGKGYHQKFGEAHAEINALKSVQNSENLRDSEMFVTLEPCAHEGKTGSCAKALSKLPLAKVTYGIVDPFPLVSGKGLEILKNAGIKVEKFEGLEEELRELAEIFFHNIEENAPFVAIKVGSSLDGNIALQSGESKWITGEESRNRVQTLRGQYDAIVIGSSTFEMDDPTLDSRDPRFLEKPSKVVIIDGDGKTISKIKGSRLTSVRPPENIFIVTTKQMTTEPFVGIHVSQLADGSLNLKEALSKLKELGIYSLLVEGGAFTFSAFLQARLVQRVHLFMAPVLLGKGLGWSSSLKISKLSESLKLRDTQVERLGQDFYFSSRLVD